ncbi:survival of motor neuron protein-like [Mercenaria mercenaria]|uniref:survival of motor neuron protein-like n=1 Tax=Mercenaria mercenaria TaxID=6596 RepID=UPI00234F1210|nr:survival of motor neuron protein-like [Mercenaria mercenaria]
MADEDGEVLFQRGKEDENEDIWDDTALIKAYDEAVSVMKMKAAEQNGLSVTDEDVLATPKSRKQNRKRGRSKKTRKWKVGDRCRARFSEDQCLYEAEIISIDDAAGTCYVRYADYGNEEEQMLKDLLRVRKAKHKQVQESENESDSGMDWRSARSSHTASHSTSLPSMAPPRQPGTSEHMPQPQFPGPMFPGMMGMPPPPPPPGHFDSAPRIPFMPPPPLPPQFSDLTEESNEALCSMLMAWYMSGYHTGYYQGLQGKKDAGMNRPFVNR